MVTIPPAMNPRHNNLRFLWPEESAPCLAIAAFAASKAALNQVYYCGHFKWPQEYIAAIFADSAKMAAI